MPVHQSSILKQRDSWDRGTGRSQGYHLEGLITIANDAQLILTYAQVERD